MRHPSTRLLRYWIARWTCRRMRSRLSSPAGWPTPPSRHYGSVGRVPLRRRSAPWCTSRRTGSTRPPGLSCHSGCSRSPASAVRPWPCPVLETLVAAEAAPSSVAGIPAARPCRANAHRLAGHPLAYVTAPVSCAAGPRPVTTAGAAPAGVREYGSWSLRLPTVVVQGAFERAHDPASGAHCGRTRLSLGACGGPTVRP